MTLSSEIRPWGEFHVLYDSITCKLKKLIVEPHKRLSLQSHVHRKECWFVLKGHGVAQINENRIYLEPHTVVHIQPQDKHRLMNDSDERLEIIEIQTGTYFGEDDIIRYEDDFQRCENTVL